MEEISIEELKKALDQLPDDMKQQLQVPQEVDSIAIKMELIKFVSELFKHNQGVNWETNKIKPKNIGIEDVIMNSQRLFDFLIE